MCEDRRGSFGGVWVGSAAPRLAVPCGTHCWLPPWHLPPACSAAACLLFHPAVRTPGTAAIPSERPTPSHRSPGATAEVLPPFERAPSMARRRGEGRRTGPLLVLHRLREAELQGHGEEIQEGAHPVRSHCLFNFIYNLWGLKVFALSEARRSFGPCADFFSFNLANWPPRQTGSQTVSSPHPPPLPPTAPLCCSGNTLRHHSPLYVRRTTAQFTFIMQALPSIGSCAPCSYTGVLILI